MFRELGMKCFKCKEKIQETFLGKINGTYINSEPVCSQCQKNATEE
ncbi:MAG: hypothetical protein ACMXX6_01510 [Candidatus Woesearchaeota archaeon]